MRDSSSPYILSYQTLRAIPTTECGEPLLAVQREAPEIVCHYLTADMEPYTGSVMYLRKEVITRLRSAHATLQRSTPELSIKLVYGYRHPAVQERYFKDICSTLKSKKPGLTDEELFSTAHNFIAVPEVAGHPTGGAVDVTITSPAGDLDMGGAIADFSLPDRIPTFSSEVTAGQRTNRLLLRSCMLAQGFAPFDGEWWHFCFGDREWAAYYNLAAACYNPIDFRTDER